jgi:hypothetical protein
MEKIMDSLDFSKVPSRRRQRIVGEGAQKTDRNIASGAHVPRIDLEAVFRSASVRGAPDSRPAMVAGAASLPTAPVRAVKSIGLGDGTRIVFADLELSPQLV